MGRLAGYGWTDLAAAVAAIEGHRVAHGFLAASRSRSAAPG